MNKLIKVEDNHYIIVSDSEIKEACYVYKNHENVHGKGIFYLPPDTDFTAFNKEAKDVSIITYSTQHMPHRAVREGQITGITAISLQEVKELIGEEDVEKKTEWEVEIETIDNRQSCNCPCHNNPNMIHFVACCNNGWIGTVTHNFKIHKK